MKRTSANSVTFINKIMLSAICFLLVSCNSADEKASPVESSAISTGAVQAKSEASQSGSDAGGIKTILNLQKSDPSAILETDCKTYEGDAKAFCDKQKIFFESQKSVLTWEKVLKNGDDFIRTFDCKKIASPFWQKYCAEHQAAIAKQKKSDAHKAALNANELEKQARVEAAAAKASK